MALTKHSFSRRLFSFLSLFAILSTLLRPFALALLLGRPTVVHASDVTAINLSYNPSTHTLNLGADHSYTLYYQSDHSTEAVIGQGSSIYLGTASAEASRSHSLLRGILKLDNTTYYFTHNNGNLIRVLTLSTRSLELTDGEQAWLTQPNTYPDLQVGVTYHAPFNPEFSLTFTSLPANPGTLTFNQLTLTPAQQQQSGSLTAIAYEVTSTMEDGTFQYSLTLPNPTPSTSVGIEYSEDGQTFYQASNVQATTQVVTANSLDHFTIFVITGIQNSPAVRINEFVYNPSSGSEWIELYNTEASDVDLTNWRLSDSSLNSVVLSGSIPAHGYKLVNVNFLDNTSNSTATETITLSYPFLNIVDRLTYTRSLLLGLLLNGDPVSSDNTQLGKSLGRSPDGGSDWTSYSTPTPGYTNLGDSTPPVISSSLSAPANALGWHNSDVEVTWTITEPESPYSQLGCDTTTISSEGSTTLTCSATSAGGAYSSSVTINLDKTLPSAPAITSPSPEQYFNSTPILNQWNPVSDSAGISEYRLEYQYDDGHSFSGGPYRTTTSTSRNHTPALSEQGGVSYRIQALDNAGNYGYWSNWRHYFFDATAPTIPVLTWPINAIFTNDNTPLMQWEDALDTYGVAGYLYRVYYNCSNPSSLITCLSLYPDSTGRWETVSELQAGTTADGTYLWQVRAQDQAGNQSDWSETEQVTIDTLAPLTPQPLSPDDSAYIRGIAFTQTWQGIADASLYEYQSCNHDPGDTGAVCSSIRYANTYSSPSKFVAAGQPNSHFWWRVRARDLSGNWSAWSESYELTIDNDAPTKTGQSIFSGWYNTAQTSVFSYTDAVSSITGTPVTCEITSEGTNQTCTITPNVCDLAGNCNTTQVTSNGANIDLSSPHSTVTTPTNAGDNTTLITNSWDGTLAGTASDSVSSVASVALSIKRDSDGAYWDGTNWVAGSEITTRVTATGTTSWSYSLDATPGEDIYTITSHATDLANNTENSYELTIVLDKTIPEVSLTVDPASPDSGNGWYKTLPQVTLSANDSNIDRIEYQWDSQIGSWTTYTTSFNLVSEGAHVLYYRALDLASNVSEIGIKNLRYDHAGLTQGPQNLSVNPNPTSGDTATVTWDAATDNIGIDYYQVQWKKGDTTHTTTVGSSVRSQLLNLLTEGTWTVIVRAYDLAHNSAEASVSLLVDRTAPQPPTLSLLGTSTGTANLAWNTVSDATSYTLWYGLSSGNYLYGANVGNLTSYTVQGLGAGTYYFIVRANDQSGNGSSNSNEVTTGTIVGAPGVAPGTPAEGFTPEPAVLGEQTTLPSLIESTPDSLNGDVLGTSRTWWSYWYLLPLFLLLLAFLIRHLRSRR